MALAACAHGEHSAYTRALDPIVKPYERLITSLPLVPPQIPMISTLTGGYAAGSRGTPQMRRRRSGS